MCPTHTVPVRLPQMGESLAEGTVVRWLRSEGDSVRRDEDLLEIETEKTSVSIPSPVDGIVRRILVPAGETVAVGTVLAMLESEQTPSSAEPTAPPSGEEPVPAEPGPPPPPLETEPPPPADTKVATGFLSPLVSRMIREHGLTYEDLRKIDGTGAGGRIRRQDVEAYLRSRAAGGGPSRRRGRRIPMSATRRTLAEHMVRSVRLAPHAGLLSAVNMQNIVEWRKAVQPRFEAVHGFRLTYTPIIVRSVARILEKFPMVNVEVDGNDILLKEDINVGVAVAAESYGLIVPVVRNANQKTILQIAREIHSLVLKTRQRKLTPSDVAAGSFTITNVGTFGIKTGLPIINHPEVAILCTGVIHPEVVAIDGRPEIRPMMNISLVFDHRVIDGELGGRFIQSISQELEGFEPPDEELELD